MSVNTANTLTLQRGLLVICLAEQQTGHELAKLKTLIIKTGQTYDENLDILVDASAIKTSEENTITVARSFFIELPFRSMALYGGNLTVNVGLRLVINIFSSPGMGEVKIFKTEEKARAWLSEYQK
ncbi:STAS/SEC14 domain-containing protein [Candidatus Saccharibacteria bacterium]|nr:STAS/SEC14 domain-containing protein [Candidatus Saccharibacteria bacterium]